MTAFISYGMSGRLASSRTLDEAKAVKTCNIVVETDDQESPRPMTRAWALVAQANCVPWWQSADPAGVAVRIAKTSLAQEVPVPILLADGVASGFKFTSQAAALRALADNVQSGYAVKVELNQA